MTQSRRTLLRRIGAGTVLLAGGVGAASASPPSEGDTIVDVAIEADGFDVLVAAVTEAGLVETLDGNRQLTVLAPTDDAFNAIGVTEDNVGEVEGLADILTYHVVPGRRDAQSVLDADELPTLNGATVDLNGPNLNGDQADIVKTDIEASNGYVHVIDGVLLP